MKIKTITNQNRRDFSAIYVCEHCGHEESGGGYDDTYFHSTVIPNMKCSACGLVAGSDYRPLAPKYADEEVI